MPTDRSEAGARLRELIGLARREACAAARQGPVQASDWGSSGGQLAAPDTDFPAGVLRGYEIRGELHRGGQGVVYEAVQLSTRRQVAVKVMREGPFAGVADRGRFEREVQILAQLRHPNIVAIHDSGQAAGHDYFVMDWISGVPLDAYVRAVRESQQPKAAVVQTLRLFDRVCDAVNAAHLRGVIHRDLKPSNIRVDVDGQPRVLDFGLAKHVGVVGDETVTLAMTQTGAFVGSLPWASPEQAAGESGLDVRTDVYSLGVMLYQALCGRMPYEVAGPLNEALDRVRHAVPPRPSSFQRRLDAELDTLVLKCLAKEPERRYQSAGELGRDLERYLAGQPIEARGDSPWYVLKKALRRHRGPVLAGTAFVVLLAASTVVALTQAAASGRAEQKAHQQFESAERISAFYSSLLLKLDPWNAQATHLNKTPADIRLPDLLREAARRVPENFADRPDLAAGLQRNIGRALNGVGMHVEAERVFRESHTAACAALGADNPATLELLRNLGNSLVNPLPTNEGVRILEDVAERTVRVLGEDHEQSLLALMSLNWAMSLSPRSEDSLRVSQRVVAVAQRARAPGDPLLAEAVYQHAVVLLVHRNVEEGERFARRAVELARPIGGGRSMYLASGYYALWLALHMQERSDEAVQVSRERLELMRAVYGAEHVEFRNSARTYAWSLASLGRCTEAVTLARDTVSAETRASGALHGATANSLSTLVTILTLCGDAAEAERLAREWRDSLDPDNARKLHPIMFELARAIDVQGRPDEAEALAMAALRESVSDTPYDMLRWSVWEPQLHWLLGRCLGRIGQFEEAEWRLLAVHDRVTSGRAAVPPLVAVKAELSMLYQAWDTAEPNKGYATKAAAWRAMDPATATTSGAP